MKFFDYDSKPMVILRMLGDLIILNVLYLVFSIPLFTIGAAGAGLYTGLRDLSDRDGNKSSFKSFMKGFKNGFGTITKIWSVVLISLGLLLYSIYALYYGIKAGIVNTNAPIIVAIIGVFLLCVFSVQLIIFHSKFDCSPMLLLKNSVMMVLGFPLHSILLAIIFYLPFAVISRLYVFLQLTPLWVAIYYSLAFLLCDSIMKKPFKKIAINAENEETEEDSKEEESEE